MDLYFDNAAAMRLLPGFDRIPDLIGNQESPVSGMAQVVAEAERKILNALAPAVADRYSVFFTNTGTDAICAVFDVLQKTWKKKEGSIALSGGEHTSLRAAAKRSGLKQIIIPCRNNGTIGPDELKNSMTAGTVLTAVHLVQPETGVVQDLASLRTILPADAVLLVDGIQGVGKVPFDFAAVKPDFFTISGQKLGIPSGAAVICQKKYAKAFRELRLTDHRVGRVPPPFIVLLADVVADWMAKQEERRKHAQILKDLLFRELERTIGGKYRRTVPETTETSPFIAHILLQNGVQGAIISRALSAYGIVTAPGSACDAETKDPSTALQWMNVPKQELWSALRISFSPSNDEEGIRFLTGKLAEILAQY